VIDTKLKLHTLLPPIAKRTGRIPDTTSLRAFLIADAPPAQIHFPDVRPMVDGMPVRSEWPTGLGWGVHGTSSISEASGYMSKFADEHGTHAFEIDLGIRIDDVKKAAATIDKAAAEATGFLIVPRLNSVYKLELFETMLGFIEASMQAVAKNKLQAKARLKLIREEWNLDKLLLQYPVLVWKFLEANPWVVSFVHQASVRIGEPVGDEAPVSKLLQIATFPMDPKRVTGAGVRQNAAIRISF